VAFVRYIHSRTIHLGPMDIAYQDVLNQNKSAKNYLFQIV